MPHAHGTAHPQDGAGRETPGRATWCDPRGELARCLVRGAAVGLLLGLLAGAGAPPAYAREGLYVGVGAGRFGFSDAIAGTEAYRSQPANPAEAHEVRVGLPADGMGLLLNGGFGLNDYLALELLLSLSRHDSRHTPPGGAAQDLRAELNTVTLGLRVGLPLGEVAEVFARAGLSGVELRYRDGNVRLADGQTVDDARFTGRGLALGAGLELFFGSVGVQLGYLRQDATLDRVNSLNFAGDEVRPALKPVVDSVFLLLNVYLQ